jgi:hypothetical protein
VFFQTHCIRLAHKNNPRPATFEALTNVLMKIKYFWVCYVISTGSYGRLRGEYLLPSGYKNSEKSKLSDPDDGGRKLLLNVDNFQFIRRNKRLESLTQNLSLAGVHIANIMCVYIHAYIRVCIYTVELGYNVTKEAESFASL